MPHIHTGPGEHDQTISAFIVRTDLGDEPKLMLHRHKKLGKLLQFGGHVELKENPWQAITHELLEESGYEISQLEVLQPTERIKKLHDEVLHPVPVCYNTHAFDAERNHYHTDVVLALVTGQPPKNNIDEGESEEFVHFTRQEFAALSRDEIYENIQAIGLFVLDTCVPKWDRVPSAEFN